jgi:site-specific DNA recombinase
MVKESDLTDCVRGILKGHIDNVVSLEVLLSGIDRQLINQQLAREYGEQITANERQLEKVLEFKSRLYENLVQGILNKEEFAVFKGKYSAETERMRAAIAELKGKLEDVLENKSERNRWMAHFQEFSTLETLDRKAVVQLIQSITVLGKKELSIRFNYDDEYEKALDIANQAAIRKVG